MTFRDLYAAGAGATLAILAAGAGLAAPAPSSYKLFQPLPEVETNGRCAADVRAIQIANDQWDRNVAERNLEGLIAVYAEDGRALPQYRPEVVGKEALRGYWGYLLSLPDFVFDTTDKRIHLSERCDQAWVYGDYHLSFRTPQGPLVDQGSYVLIYEKRDGAWKLVLDIDNSDVQRAEK